MANIYNRCDDECVPECCETINENYENKFIKELCNIIMNALDVNYNERRIVGSLLYKSLEHIKHRDGLLEQYLHSQLDEILYRFKREFDLDKDIKINYNYATHAKFSDMMVAIREKIKKENNE